MLTPEQDALSKALLHFVLMSGCDMAKLDALAAWFTHGRERSFVNWLLQRCGKVTTTWFLTDVIPGHTVKHDISASWHVEMDWDTGAVINQVVTEPDGVILFDVIAQAFTAPEAHRLLAYLLRQQVPSDP